MIPNPDPIGRSRDPEPLILRILIGAALAAGAAALAGVVAAVVLIATGVDEVSDIQSQFLALKTLFLAGILLSGLTACGLLLGAFASVRGLRALLDQTRLLEQRTAVLAEQAVIQAANGQTPKPPTLDPAEVMRVLADIREILLLPDDQRAARFRALVQQEFRRRMAIVDQHIAARSFHRAREQLAWLTERFGPSDGLKEAEIRLVATMKAALAEDLESVTNRVADLMGMAHWEQAEQLARELTERYPDAGETRRLLERVRAERQLFDQRHRQRMHEEIQQFVHQRRWREAARAARQFIETFPTGVDTDALRLQLATLTANEEIEVRQQLERHYKEYIQRQQYWDALELARRMITEYPFSPQANALRSQLPRLEQLAQQQGVRH